MLAVYYLHLENDFKTVKFEAQSEQMPCKYIQQLFLTETRWPFWLTNFILAIIEDKYDELGQINTVVCKQTNSKLKKYQHAFS